MQLFSLTDQDSQYRTRWKKSCTHCNPVHSCAKNGSEITSTHKVVCLLRTSFFSFGVLTNKMIKQEVSVTNYCKHVNQSLIPSELPPGAVMGNKMKKQSKLLNSFGEKWPSQSPGDASSKQDPSWSRAAPLLCSAEAVWPESCWTPPTTAWLCPDISAVPIPFTFYAGSLHSWTRWLSPLP